MRQSTKNEVGCTLVLITDFLFSEVDSSMSKFKLAVVIGRFQPVHTGHVSIIKEAMKLADNLVILVGSSFRARDIQNPWTFDERRTMLSNVFNDVLAEAAALDTSDRASESPVPNLIIKPIQDSLYNDSKWLLDVQSAITDAYAELNGGSPVGADDVVVVGHMKAAERPRICPVCGTPLSQDEYLIAAIFPDLGPNQKRQAHIYGCRHCYVSGGVNLTRVHPETLAEQPNVHSV
jgi:cytidyltransferase-like protein